MKPKLFLFVTLTALLYGSVAMAQEKHEHPVGKPEELGNVYFPVSCSAAAQRQFERAIAMLHSFWYEEAEKAFAEVTATDPSCAMGYWGIAMSLYHPIWYPPDTASLKKGGRYPKGEVRRREDRPRKGLRRSDRDILQRLGQARSPHSCRRLREGDGKTLPPLSGRSGGGGFLCTRIAFHRSFDRQNLCEPEEGS